MTTSRARQAAASEPKVIALDPKTFGETSRRQDDRPGDGSAGGGAAARRSTTKRIAAVQEALSGPLERPASRAGVAGPGLRRGHWTPQLVEFAGGEDVLGLPGALEQTTWETVAAAEPTRRRHAVRLRRAAVARAGARVRAEIATLGAEGRRGQRERVLLAAGPGWSTASSCSRTSCIPTASRAAAGAARWSSSSSLSEPLVLYCTRRPAATAPTGSSR